MAEQCLDLISENMQLKQKVAALHEYNSIIRAVDKQVISNSLKMQKGIFLPVSNKAYRRLTEGISAISDIDTVKKSLKMELFESLRPKREKEISDASSELAAIESENSALSREIAKAAEEIDETMSSVEASGMLKKRIQDDIKAISEQVAAGTKRNKSLAIMVDSLQAKVVALSEL